MSAEQTDNSKQSKGVGALVHKQLLEFLRPDQIVVEQSQIEREARSTLPKQRFPDLILYPESLTEVQSIVKIANRSLIPIWYVSTGKNWGYGCRSASYSGGMTLILERMKRIELVDERLGYAVIEPGVTYADLQNFLVKNGINLWTDSAGTTQSASIIGNALDKGRGLTPYADHFGMLCGLDVVMADGELLSAGPSHQYHCKHLYKWGVGPHLDGFFTQSNLGIVVRSGLWLMPKPEKFVFFAFEYHAESSRFGAFIEDFRKLVFNNGLLSRPHLANDFAMLCIVDRYPKDSLAAGERTLSADTLQRWKKRHGVPDWTFGGGLYGTSAQIKAQKKLVRRHLSPYGKVRFLGDTTAESMMGKLYRNLIMFGAKLDGKSDQFISQIFPAMDLFKGKPTDEFAKQVYFKSALPRPECSFSPTRDNCGFIWTGPLVPFAGEHITRVLEISQAIFKEYRFDYFVELIVESPRVVIALFGVFFDPRDREEAERAQGWYQRMRTRMNLEGYHPYRETSESTGLALEGNPLLKTTLSRVKGALDERRILAPGRYGIF